MFSSPATLLLSAHSMTFLRVPTVRRALVALVLTLLFAFAAKLLHAVTAGGAVAGAAVSFVLFLGGGPGAFLSLLTLFVLTWLATRCGYQRKEILGTAESGAGRTASQVLANLEVAALAVALSAISHRPLPLLLAGIAALAEAAADTVSSEFGQAMGPTAYLITSFKPVPPGTNGGVSLAGTIAGIVAAGCVAMVAAAAGTLPLSGVAWVTLAATFGTFADSFLGAWLEAPGRVSNDGVNFFSTLIAGAMALLLSPSHY